MAIRSIDTTMKRQTVLAEVPGKTRNEQLLVCLAGPAGETWKIELHQQRWAEGIGWYDQKVISLEPSQWRSLQQLLASPVRVVVADAAEPPATVPFRRRQQGPQSRSLADGT